ncbi:vitamin B12 dependent-methionine synthase activation domain-containing protein [Chloroflexota bacterium]
MLALSTQVDIDSQQVLHNIGYDTDGEPPVRMVSLVNEYLENADHLIDPSYSYVMRDIELVQGSRVVIEDSVTFESKVVARLLEQCEKVVVFALTIGNHLEDMVAQLVDNRLVLQATVLDAIGSSAAEKMGDFVQERISKAAGTQGLCTSRRFSPGYCDWEVSQQKMVFRAMNGDVAGVRLTEECLMLPRKSMSGIIGIGPRNGKVENYNPCKTCIKHDCPERR